MTLQPSVNMAAISSVFRAGLFANKVAIVTGGASGIGKAISQELLYLGCKVVIASRNQEKLENAVREMKTLIPDKSTADIKEVKCNIRNEKEALYSFFEIFDIICRTSAPVRGCKVVIASRNQEKLENAVREMKTLIPDKSTADIKEVKCNIRNEKEVEALMASTLNHYGKIDYLVNNGGGQFPSLLSDMKLKGWNAVIDTNLTGTFLCSREAYNKWMVEHGGVIVNIIADMWNGFPIMGHTGAARAGVENLTKTASLEWAASGVRINCVAPGTVYSESAAANYKSPEIFENAIPSVPAKRLGKVEEISAAVCFLLSPAAAYITGETIKVDGASSLYGQTGWHVPDHEGTKAYEWKKDIEELEKSKL